jgi:uncharacterized protein YjiK
VGDEGTLAELDAEGTLLGSRSVGRNLEDVAVHEPSGHLVLLDEVDDELLVFDPAAWRTLSRWKLDRAALVDQKAKARDGFEGLAFKPEPGRPGGGIFYLTHQRGPAMLVAVAFDPMGGGGTIGADHLAGRWPLPGRGDLTAVTWSAALQRLLVLADAEDQLLVLDGQANEQGRLHVSGTQQEGVALDPQGTLWVADDRAARVVRHPGALAAIQAALVQAAAGEPPQEPEKKKKRKD